jgi:hypothetical protein
MHRRAYQGADDLHDLQKIVAERPAMMGIGTNLHTGDIACSSRPLPDGNAGSLLRTCDRLSGRCGPYR